MGELHRISHLGSRRRRRLRCRDNIGLFLSDDIGNGFAVLGPQPIEVDQPSEAFRSAIRDRGDDHAAITVTNQDDVVQILPIKDAHDVVDMGFEIHRGAEQVSALTKTGERRREHLVTSSPQAINHPLPTPSTMTTS